MTSPESSTSPATPAGFVGSDRVVARVDDPKGETTTDLCIKGENVRVCYSFRVVGEIACCGWFGLTLSSISASKASRPGHYLVLKDDNFNFQSRTLPLLGRQLTLPSLFCCYPIPPCFFPGGYYRPRRIPLRPRGSWRAGTIKYDRNMDKVIASLKGHTKNNQRRPPRTHRPPTLLLSAGADKITKIWTHDSNADVYMPASTIRLHKGELTGPRAPDLYARRDALLDKTYALHDLTTIESVFRSEPGEDMFTMLGVHPAEK